MYQDNPFIIEGYVAPKYFCDREDETRLLVEHIANGRNVALIAKRRLDKSGLIHNMVAQAGAQQRYNTFFIDIDFNITITVNNTNCLNILSIENFITDSFKF